MVVPEPLKYLSSFFLPGCVVWFLSTGPHNSLTALAWTLPLWVLILLDYLGPKVKPTQQKAVLSDRFYNAILYLLAFLQCLIIALLVNYASQLQWSTTEELMTSLINLLVLRILVGTSSGSSAIIVAHELIHRPRPYQQMLGRLLLYSVCYEHFIIAHLRGHHLSVATPQDIATARLSESFKHYWKRVYIGHFKYAWHFEQKRLGLSHHPSLHYKILANSVLQGLVIEILLLIFIVMSFGWTAGFIFLYQALAAVRLLETINYYQHWGLEQGQTKNTLAWVNQSSLSEYALIGLANHIAHHKNAALSFHQKPYLDQGPKMPYGYFVTNLWVKLNNKSYCQTSTQILKNWLSS